MSFFSSSMHFYHVPLTFFVSKKGKHRFSFTPEGLLQHRLIPSLHFSDELKAISDFDFVVAASEIGVKFFDDSFLRGAEKYSQFAFFPASCQRLTDQDILEHLGESAQNDTL